MLRERPAPTCIALSALLPAQCSGVPPTHAAPELPASKTSPPAAKVRAPHSMNTLHGRPPHVSACLTQMPVSRLSSPETAPSAPARSRACARSTKNKQPRNTQGLPILFRLQEPPPFSPTLPVIPPCRSGAAARQNMGVRGRLSPPAGFGAEPRCSDMSPSILSIRGKAPLPFLSST